MKFEKLSDNKIRIILTMQDLTEKHIDFHSFMSNSIESQNILLDMLEEAKKETGFDPEDSNLKIEALAMADTNFIFTITKVYSDTTITAEKAEAIEKFSKRKFTIKRKSLSPVSTTQAVYMFNCFDDFCNFLHFLNKGHNISEIADLADDVLLYSYKDCYYLLISNVHTNMASKINFYATVTEFAKCISNSKGFASKLCECGTLIMKNNALEIGFKHFV